MHRGQDFNEPLVRSYTGARIIMTAQCLLHRGMDFNDVPVRSRTGAKFSMRPQWALAQGPEFQSSRTGAPMREL